MITDTNPFVYSRPIDPDEIIDRDEETRKLLGWAVGGHYVRLFAPRKFGKTSLLGRVLRDGERSEGLIPVMVDLYGVLSVADVAVRIERAYAKQLRGAIRKKVDDFLRSTGLGLSLGAYGFGVRITTEPRTDPLPALHALLDLPLRLEASGGFRALIAFDEFQDITKVPDMDALIRSHIQHQGEVASYVFSGSEAAMMSRLFEDKTRPLYGSAVPMKLGRLADAASAPAIVARFEETGRDVGDALQPLLAAARGHPQRVVHLAHRLWEEVAGGETAAFGDWERAFESALVEVEPEFDAHWRGLGANEQRTLRAVVAGGGTPLRASVLAQLGLEKSTAFYALKRLVLAADVEQRDGRYELVDPLFGEWISRL